MWEDDQFHGVGTFTWADGRTWTCVWDRHQPTYTQPSAEETEALAAAAEAIESFVLASHVEEEKPAITIDEDGAEEDAAGGGGEAAADAPAGSESASPAAEPEK